MLEGSTSPENPVAGDPENIGSGHRWPRKETIALLDIRSSLDAKFRDSSAKAPLWEEVSRKMGELGFSRSAKKCKEKFENIYKYHKRTRDGRSGRGNGKTYRFFEQLEALDHHSLDQPLLSFGEIQPETSPGNVILNAVPCSVHKPIANLVDTSTPSTSSSSSQESEGTRKKKRKLTQFFESLMKEVVERQESLQRTFIEALEKCERERIAREEAWKAQELARMKKETELLVKERSIAAAKDAAVLAFLKKFADQSDGVQFPDTLLSDLENEIDKHEKSHGGSENTLEKGCLETQEKYSNRGFVQMSSSRWPKEEVDALIRLRTDLETRYQDNAPKGPLWEEISASMEKLGYNRSAKRCKEKWENINKYFKRVKESNKKRFFNSKTCPYFDQLDALYSKKTKNTETSIDSGYDLRPEELLMHMMGGDQEEQAQMEKGTEDGENENADDDHPEGSFEIGNEQIGAENSEPHRTSSDKAASMDKLWTEA